MATQIYGIPTKSELNPKLWDSSNRLLNNVREACLLIAEKFYEYLDLDEDYISDIRLVGSNTSYSWSAKSDVDIHLILNFSKIKSSNNQTLRNLFNSKKNQFNEEFDIKIFGHDVELYVEDIDDDNKSESIYSLRANVWIKKPKKESQVSVNKKDVLKRYDILNSIIDKTINMPINMSNFDKAIKLKEYIVNMRKKGLSSSKSNYSVENIVFKTLRGNGKLKKLKEYLTKSQSEILSLTEKK